MDEVGELRAQVQEQGLALEGLTRANADAEERRSTSHDELVLMMSALMKTTRERESQMGSGGEEQLPTDDTAGRAGVSPLSERSGGGSGSRQGGRVPAEAEPRGDQLGRRGDERGASPTGEISSTAADGFASRQFFGIQKMAVPQLKGRENFDSFSRQMKVYSKLYRFEAVFESDPYVEVGADGNDRVSLKAQGVKGPMYERQLMAWAFLSQALQSKVDQSTFHRSKSPRECWELIQEWYDTKSNAQKGVCMRELYRYKIEKEDDPVEKLYEMEDLRVKLINADMSVDDNTLYACFVSALPADEYSLEIRDLNLKQVYDRKEIINLVRSRYEALRLSFGKSKGSSNSLALVGNGGRGNGAKGGRGHGGRGRSGKGKEGGGNDGAKDSKTCFRCRATGHFSNKCTTKLCERCGGRGHESSKCASPADMDGSPAEAVLAMVGDPGDDAVETTAFRRVQQQHLKSYSRSIAVGTLAVRSGKGGF